MVFGERGSTQRYVVRGAPWGGGCLELPGALRHLFPETLALEALCQYIELTNSKLICDFPGVTLVLIGLQFHTLALQTLM